MNKYLQQRIQILLENRIAWHIGFWILYFLFDYLGAGGNRMFELYFVHYYCYRMLGILVFAYITILVLYPYFFSRKQFLGYALSGLFLAILLAFYFVRIYQWFELEGFQKFETITAVPFNYFLFALITFLKLGKEYYFNLQQQTIQNQLKTEQELAFLKSQISPHFLFNTMNNLYGLSVVKSDQLPKLMLQLSDLLRYSLYETNQNFVPLKKEIDYLNNYIHLEKIRMGKLVDVHVHFPETAIDNIFIAPIVLIVFVENAFKHARAVVDEKIVISIELKREEDWLVFTSTNPFVEKEKESSSGIGLDNVRKRLAHLYPNEHSIEMIATGKEYSVIVRLKAKYYA